MSSAADPSLSPEQLLQGWAPKRVGRRIVVLPEAASTNTVALDAAGETDADGLVILADYQTAGRGRQGRIWLSPRRASVLCSVLLLSEMDPPDDSAPAAASIGGRLTLLSAVAACQGIRTATEITPAIKWPNDIRVAGRKLGGILLESRSLGRRTRAWAIGIGINCLQHEAHFPPELRGEATSLEIEASHAVHRLDVARALLRSLDEWLATPESHAEETVHATWMSYAEPLGRHVRLRREGMEYTGRILAIDPAGGLVFQCDDGRREWFDPMLTSML